MTPAQVSTDTFDKGIARHEQGRVLGGFDDSFLEPAGTGHLYVTVAGDSDVYLVHLVIEDGQAKVGEHRCTCPAHVTCWHIVAALAAWTRGEVPA